MTYYRIKRFDTHGDKEDYYVYQGKDEVEVALNAGYSAARDLLEYVHYAAVERRQATVLIYYRDERLHYYVKDDRAGALEALRNWVPRCEWAEEPFAPDTSFAKEKITLRGSASPLAIKDREENLLDELVRALPKETLLLQLKLGAADAGVVAGQIARLEQTINDMSQRASVQVGEQANLLAQVKKTIAGGDNLSYQLKDVSVQKQLDLLENHLYTLHSQGAVFSSAEWTIYAGKGTASLLASKMEAFSRRSGSLSLHRLRTDEPSSVEFLNYVSANYLATLLAFPMKPVPGFTHRRGVVFGADAETSATGEALALGRLVLERETRVPVRMPLDDLTKHAFVTGVTGSGKTSTVKSLLLQAYERGRPFLVIEPAKTEYKYLDAAVPSLKRYVLGLDGPSSLKLNPFAFPEHIHIQTHLDHLKSVFIAAFPMYGPMPYILETAFYDIYRRTGWDFVSGRNLYESRLPRERLFPTLEDLHAAIDPAIQAVGYSADLASDIRGALKVRIGSLLSGAKGAMLNCRAGVPAAELLRQPAVVELEHVGDDQEKVFLMGLLLISIYEHYVSEGTHSSALRHLIVIEEAHRLLENVRATGNPEQADMKGKAVETFNNMLSEIRTYGQGFLIADQIPSKLSPDVIKNTNLKIVHRLFAKDDRHIVGDSIGLEEEEIGELLRLKQGEAVVFHGSADAAMKAKVDVPAATLASQRGDVQRPETVRFDAAEFLLQQEPFLREGYRLANACLLFPELREDAERRLSEWADDRFEIKVAAEQAKSLWGKLLERYLLTMRFRERMSYVQFVRFSDEIAASDDPLDCMLRRSSDCVGLEEANHPMRRFSKSFQAYRRFRFLFRVNRDRLLAFLAGQANRLHYESLSAVDLLLKQAELADDARTDLMTADQRKQLCYAMLLTELEEQREWLEAFFGVGDLAPPGLARKM